MENFPLSLRANLLCLVLFICEMHFGCWAKAYSNISCIGSERRALLDFKKGLIDESNRLSSWTGENCCTWEGIGCNMHTGRVVKLDLHNPLVFDVDRYFRNPIEYYDTFLKGGISPSLLNLKYLQHLDLSCNNFLGHKIPTFFGSFKYMRYLNLSASYFHGQIPTNLGNLSKLQYLDLGGNILLDSKSLWWITALSSLKSLSLSDVNLSGADDWLRAVNTLPSLFSLNLKDCILQNLSILSHTNFTSLVSLDLSANDFNTSFPLWLFNVSSIEILNLGGNLFQGKLPTLFEKLTSLTKLDLLGNKLNSSFPNSLCTLVSLTYIDLSENSFQGKLPCCLENLTSLTILHLGSNRFQGVIPFEIGHLQKLSQLDLSFNELNGTISPSLGQLEKLQYLDISYNSFIGELTEIHFAKLVELKYLDVSWNLFRLRVNPRWFPPFQLREIIMDGIRVGSEFPQWLKTQKRVEMLQMYNASISDQIPNWFEVICSQIRVLILSHNQISGKPPQIKGAPDYQFFRYIDLSFNKFEGSLNSIPRHTNVLFMSNNHLTGQIPSLDDYLTTDLFLGDNDFTGNIPSTICNHEELLRLDLSNNHLSGEIPFCLGNLQHLGYLNLANNSFSGQIPSSFGNLGKSLELLQLNGNKFHGKLPPSLQNLTSLRLLDLGNNQFSGTLPRWLDKGFQDLVWLGLQSNNFNGSIPLELCKLSKLRVLNLDQNSFTGFIPRCFGNFTAMKKDLEYQRVFVTLWIYGLFDKKHEFFSIPIKGTDLRYTVDSMLATSIALSENKIVGEIPKELMNLVALQSLNLSKNHLDGRIPENIGNLKSLESLDLSRNELSGSIPPSLATIDTLGYLNLSFNKLSGPIPQGNHFQTFDDKSIYEGNSGLCGKPLLDNCTDNKPSKKDGSIKLHQGESSDILWFYAGIGPGFAAGFMGVFSALWLKKSWRYAYFKFVENFCSHMRRKFSRE